MTEETKAYIDELLGKHIAEYHKKRTRKPKADAGKVKYMDYVFLTPDEHKQLIQLFGEKMTTRLIGDLNFYVGSKGDKYKSHYMTIRKWARDKNVPESKESSFKHTCSCGCGKEGTVQVSNKWYNVDCKKRILGW